MKMKKIISATLACVLLCGAAFGVHATSLENSSLQVAAVSYDSSELAEYAERVAVLVNQERTANGLQPVQISPQLSEAANIRAEELIENFSHTRPDGSSCFTAMTELGIQYSAAAENIAYGQKNPESVMHAWMESSGHRANILNQDMDYIGVGVVYRNGIYYWSQFFAVSDQLSEGAYLPGEDIITTTPSATTEPITTQTTIAKPVTTEQATTDAEQVITTQETTDEPVTTKQTTTVQSQTTDTKQTTDELVTTEQTTTTIQSQTTAAKQTTTCKWVETTDCILTAPVISLPELWSCTSIGDGAFVMIYHK